MRAASVRAGHNRAKHSRAGASSGQGRGWGHQHNRVQHQSLCSVPVVGVLHSDCKPVAVVKLLLKGWLHGLRMKNGSSKEGQLCSFIIGQKGDGPRTLD